MSLSKPVSITKFSGWSLESDPNRTYRMMTARFGLVTLGLLKSKKF
jgi:hypothetical protein